MFDNFVRLFVVGVSVSLISVLAHAEGTVPEEPTLTKIIGKVQLPKQLGEGINTEGLSLAQAVVQLKGRYDYPRLPYPENWRELTRDERREWLGEFRKSEAYQGYLQKVKAAEAKRYSVKTRVAQDGSFCFEGISPDWYELRVTIMHPACDGEPDYKQARAHVLRQFFVKNTERDHDLGLLTLEVKNVLMPGDMAPDFKVQKYDGGEFKLSDYRGKYVLFDFWATWCGPCIAEMPNLEAAHRKYGGERFAVIGLSVDEKIKQPRAFIKKKKPGYVHGYVGEKAGYSKIRVAYGIRGIPSIWLIGPDGKIIARDLRGASMEKAVAEALKTGTR